jgi:hypothetical protein
MWQLYLLYFRVDCHRARPADSQLRSITSTVCHIYNIYYIIYKVKAIPLHYQILRQLAHEGGKVVSPTYWPPLPPGNIPGTHFC